MNRFTIPLLAFVVVVALLGVGLTLKPRELPSPLLGKPAPAFELPSLPPARETFSSAQMRGDAWLLNVWASWCEACRTEHPLLNRLAQAGSVHIVGLNYKDDAADADAWLRRFGNPYTHIAFDRHGRVGIEYGVYGVPETYLIDRHGIIRFKHIGPLTPDILRRRLLPLVETLNGDSA